MKVALITAKNAKKAKPLCGAKNIAPPVTSEKNEMKTIHPCHVIGSPQPHPAPYGFAGKPIFFIALHLPFPALMLVAQG
jgi:hypothetical protein